MCEGVLLNKLAAGCRSRFGVFRRNSILIRAVRCGGACEMRRRCHCARVEPPKLGNQYFIKNSGAERRAICRVDPVSAAPKCRGQTKPSEIRIMVFALAGRLKFNERYANSI